MKLPEPARTVWVRHRDTVARLAREEADTGRVLLGGGTILAARWGHRLSTDIDVLLPDRTSLHDGAPGAPNDLAKATGGELEGAAWDRIKVQVDSGSLDVSAIRPQLPGLERQEEVEGRDEIVLGTAQILHGKLRRAEEGLARDAFDLIAAEKADPRALQHAVNALDDDQLLIACAQLRSANDEMARAAPHALAGTTAGFEADLDNLGHGAERVLEANRYTQVKIHLKDRQLTIERRTAKGHEASETYAGTAPEKALRDSGLGMYLTANHGTPAATAARGIEALRQRGQEGVIFDSDDPRSRNRLVEAAREAHPPQRAEPVASAEAWAQEEFGSVIDTVAGPPVPKSTLDSQSLLHGLVADGRLNLSLGAFFKQPAPCSAGQVPWDRVRGMMLGLAIGDALGNTTESLLPGQRRQLHGEIREYLPHPYAGDRPIGLPSDDSQLAFWTLEHLVRYGTLIPDRLAETFASRTIFGIGSAVRQFVAGMQQGEPWWRSSARSAGNGALMRIAPIAIPHIRMADPTFWSDAALCAAITHNDRASIGACVAFAGMLSELLSRRRPPAPDWWVSRYVELAQQVEGETGHTPRGGALQGSYRGPIWRFVQERVPPAVVQGKSVLQAGNEWFSGAYLLETVPTVLFILSRYGGDPQEAIIRAVNDTKDNDTVAAIVGAAVGALHGEHALPAHWRNGLVGRTTADDDGRVFELLDRAELAFGCERSIRQAGAGSARRGAGTPTAGADTDGIVNRAQGCLLGQLAGDALGSLVEFETPEAIRRSYPRGVRRLATGGTWNTVAGQPTDDSELALVLARTLVEHARYDREAARQAYVWWLRSSPFDCGNTVAAGLTGPPNAASQANGALMRISPLGIFATNHDPVRAMEWARQDAALTHPHEVCCQANALFAAAISFAIRSGCDAEGLYRRVCRIADNMTIEPTLQEAIKGAAQSPPADYVRQQGWALIALHNAMWQLLNATTMEEGVVDTVMRGGDTDTNAAICGALLGAVHGRNAFPRQWLDTLLGCRPEAGRPGVRHPRPEVLWPVDSLQLAVRLVEAAS